MSAPLAAARPEVSHVLIPAGSTGFHARAAIVYLPPAARSHPNRLLPMLELLHGTPGSPSDWLTHGRLVATMRAFAAQHGGRAPVVVIPDINGSRHADSECVRTTYGADVERYLTVNVPQYVLSHYPVTPDHNQWAVAGLSEGGMCAAMLALRSHPGYRAFGDLSGLSRPTLGPHDDPERTIQGLFDGSLSEYEAHDVVALLKGHTFPQLAGWLTTGADDAEVRAAQTAVVAAARAAGVQVHASVVPGGHSWSVWRADLTQMLSWLWSLFTHRG